MRCEREALAFARRQRAALLHGGNAFFDHVGHEHGVQYRSEIHCLRSNGRDVRSIGVLHRTLRPIEGEHDLVSAVAKIDGQAAADAVDSRAIQERLHARIAVTDALVPQQRGRPHRPAVTHARIDLDVAVPIVFGDPFRRNGRPQIEPLVVLQLLARTDRVQERSESHRLHEALQRLNDRIAFARGIDQRQ